mgnify:CR=1 FL=1
MDTEHKAAEQTGDETHDWFTPIQMGYECCRQCGIIRRADHKNRPCRGWIGVTLRDGDNQ